jgi:hypothetical protein
VSKLHRAFENKKEKKPAGIRKIFFKNENEER